ncbi:hypothetical protein BpHYR1_035635 [Brachionus plicatilis]|uniref:Uncharacterized protein n=1 Tax=Brachionus plicatilis TaxID=10195 RepID=A0A3M7RPT8_BRAPC|nr:hypothetical protein BpHYR1_035635 [Brachionus plicatilis]
MFRLRATNNRNSEAHTVSSFKPSKPINQTNYLFRRNPTNLALHKENAKTLVTFDAKITSDRIFVNSVQKGLPLLNQNFQRSQTSINTRSKPSSGRSTVREIENSRPLPPDCNCVLCLNKILIKRYRAKTSVPRTEDKWTVDSRHFLETLDKIQLSVKVNRNYSSKDLNNSTSDSDQKSESQSSEKPRYLHKASRIKLWKPNDVDKWVNNNKIDSEVDTDFSDISSKESSSSLKQRDGSVEYELNNLNYPTNPPTSPLSFFRIPVALPMDD